MQTLKNKLMDSYIGLAKLHRYVSVKLGYLAVTDGQYGLYDYQGLPCSTLIHPPHHLHLCRTFDNFADDDLIILTYPKSGTHFLADVVNSIYLEKGLYSKEKDHIFCATPFEMRPPIAPSGLVKKASGDTEPRVFGSHWPWDLMPPKVKSHQVKVIHLMRNPKDVACSAFPFFKRIGMFTKEMTWEQFFDYFISGRILHGDYFNFIRQWYPNRNSPNNMYLYYEDMLQDLGREVRRIAEFLDLELTDEQVGRIVEANTFSNVKKKVGDTFIHRQGKSGGWRSKLTVEQNAAADQWIKKGLQGLDDISLKYD